MITLGLIGIGKWGSNYLETAKKIKGCQIKYIASQTSQSLSRFSNSYIKTTNYEDFIKFPDLDGIIIATPGSTHSSIIKKLMKKDFYILVEKPLTTDLGDALKIKEAYKGRNAKIFVGHIYLYNPIYLKIRELLPRLGQIKYISFKGCQSPVRDDMSVLWEWGPHGISICLDLLNEMPKKINAFGIKTLRPMSDLYDHVFASLEFKNNVFGFLEFNWLSPIKKRELIIYGRKGTLVFDDLAARKLVLYENFLPKAVDIKYDFTPSLEMQLREFINFIKNGKTPKTDLDEAIKVAKVIDVVEKSLSAETTQSVN